MTKADESSRNQTVEQTREAVRRVATAPNVLPSADQQPSGTTPVGRTTMARRLSYIMLLRVAMYTLLLGGTIVMYFALGTPEQLAGPYVTVLFVLIIVVYLLTILYATLLKSVRRMTRMAIAQIATDMMLGASIVHLTGSAESAFVLFLFLTPITAAVTLGRRAAVITAAVGSVVLSVTVLFGYSGMLPVLADQVHLPWDVSPADVGRSILINSGAMFALAALSDYLAEQLRTVGARVEAQEAHIGDLAALHTDVIRCLTSGLVTVDSQGAVLTINQTAAEILCTEEIGAIGKQLAQLVPELADVVAGAEQVRRGETIIERDGQTSILGVSTSPLTDHENRRIGRIINFQDLTVLREMEQTIKRSEHLAALGRVAAAVAHEIRNPMASISGSLELLCQDDSANGDSKKLMQIALREIERLDGLIVELLKYARPKPPTLVPVEICSAVTEIATAIEALQTDDYFPRVRVESVVKPLWVRADRDQLHGVLWNLVRNAWQAGERKAVRIRLNADGDTVTIDVMDRGKGIGEEDSKHVFEPFFTTRDTGSGLGLATVHRIIQGHEGAISIDSRVGQGTTVRVRLPRIADPYGGS